MGAIFESGELAIVDVGHGNAAVLRAEGVVVVIDTARGSSLLEYLATIGVSEVDLVVLSHSDADHIGGLIALLGNVRVKRVVVNGDGTKDTVAWADLAVALDDAHSRGDVVVDPGLAAGHIAVDGLREFSIEVVAPSRRLVLLGVGNADPELGRITSNTLSACIRIMVGERPVALLAGDLDEVGLADIARAARPIEAEVLVFPHHGGSPGGRHVGSFVQRLLDLVRPTSVVFSNGRARFNNPRPEIVDAVLRHSPSVYIACSQLSEECSPTVASQRAHLPPCYSAGGAAGFSCAGTVVCTAGPSGASIPSAPRHVDFVEQHVASPMCRRRIS